MDLTGRIWIIALWFMTLGWTSILALREITSCLEAASEVSLYCDNNYMILVTRAFLGRTRDKDIDKFCSSPHSSNDDCRSKETTLTADVGRSCSTFGNGRYTVPSTDPVLCGDGYTGYSYIHVEYECLPRKDPTTAQMIPWGDMLGVDNVEGTLVYIMSRSYGEWNGASHSSCRVNVPQGAKLSATIYDFRSNTSNTECSARLLVTADTITTVCAATSWNERTLHYEATSSGRSVDFLMQQRDSTTASRLWVFLNATGKLFVKCGADVVTLPPTTSSVSTTTTTATTGDTTTTSTQKNNGNTTLTTPSDEETTQPTRHLETSSLAVPTSKPLVEETSTADQIVNFLKDNIIAFTTAGAILFLLLVVVCIMCVVSRKRRTTKTDEHEVIDGWLWQSQPPAAGLSHPGSNASTLNKHDTIDPYAASGDPRPATGPSPPPDTSDLYAVPIKKKKPQPTDAQPTYTNIDEANNSELVYGYAREIS